MTARQRVDRMMLARGLVESRSRAQALIAAGKVESGGKLIKKASETLSADAPLEVTGSDHPWVSRGGVKLAHALRVFDLNVEGRLCLDIGASTGGFTEVLLSCGAQRVYAVDVGRDQLHPRLAKDPRVVSLESVNARYLEKRQVPEPIDLLVCDASFISLTLVLPAPMALVRKSGCLIALIKPQFELGAGKVGKGGVVRDAASHAEACDTASNWLADQPGWKLAGITESPITGPQGNREFLMLAERHS